MHRPLLSAALCLTLLGGAACGDDPGDNGTPITPTPTEITEPPFTGTLTINGGVTTPFVTTTAGTVTAILSSLEPAQGAIGLSLGTWNGTSCQWIVANDNVGIGGGIAGLASGAGNLCARVYDVGKLTQAVTFNVTIKHF